MCDILFKTDDYVFSYRVAGICIQNNLVLLQKPVNEDVFAFPGGHVSFNETNKETLQREFFEEIGEIIAVKQLKWIGEIFFPWNGKTCHQICLFYEVSLLAPNIPLSGSFIGSETMDVASFDLEFHWVDIRDLHNIILYPTIAASLISKWDEGIHTFIERQENR